MKSTQIKEIIKTIGNYEMNQIIPLTEVQSIVLASDENIYPSDTTRVKFVDEGGKNLMEVYEGVTKQDGTFVSKPNPILVMSFSNINGFVLASPKRRKAPYNYGGVL